MLRPYGIPCIALARRAPPRIVAFRGSIWPVRKTGGGVTAYRFPDSNVFYRKLGRSYPRIVRGEGCWLYDEQGKDYLDAVGGAYVANLGHSNPDVADALARQAREFGYLSATAFTHGPVEELARELAASLPGDLDKLYFLSSGSEAVEAALKLARPYWVEAGKPGKHRIIALAPSNHANPLRALSSSALEQYKLPFREWLVDATRIPAPYAYRCECRGADAACPTCSGTALEAAIRRAGADTVAAFIAEPVGGSSTGASTPRPEYFRTIREICDRYRSEEHTSELQSQSNLVCRLLLEKKNNRQVTRCRNCSVGNCVVASGSSFMGGTAPRWAV